MRKKIDVFLTKKSADEFADKANGTVEAGTIRPYGLSVPGFIVTWFVED